MGDNTVFGKIIRAPLGGVQDQANADLQSQLSSIKWDHAPMLDESDEAIKNARIFERRRQLGLQGRMSTFLTTAQGEGPTPAPAASNTLLGT